MKHTGIFLKSILAGTPLFVLLGGFALLLAWQMGVSLADWRTWLILVPIGIFSFLMGNAAVDPGDCAGY